VFTYLKVKSAKCLCLLPMVLDLLFRSWFSYFDVGFKELVLFTSLLQIFNDDDADDDDNGAGIQ